MKEHVPDEVVQEVEYSPGENGPVLRLVVQAFFIKHEHEDKRQGVDVLHIHFNQPDQDFKEHSTAKYPELPLLELVRVT